MNASQHHRRTSSAGTATISSSSSSEYDEKQKYESVNSSPYTLNTSTFRSTPPSPTTPSYGACAYYNDTLLDSPKSPRLPTTWEGSQRTGTFAPMCKVEDPTVIREQRRRVFVAAIYGLFFAAVMAIPTFVPPNLHQ